MGRLDRAGHGQGQARGSGTKHSSRRSTVPSRAERPPRRRHLDSATLANNLKEERKSLSCYLSRGPREHCGIPVAPLALREALVLPRRCNR